MTPEPGPTCPSCSAPLISDAAFCAGCGAPVVVDPPAAGSSGRSRRLLAGAAVLVLVVVAAVLALRPGSTPADPPGRLLPTATGVSHGEVATLVSCSRAGGVTDVKVRIANATQTATDVAVTVGVTNPTTGASYDAVVARYAQLDRQQNVTIEAVGTREVPKRLACQILRVELEKGA